MYLVIVKQNVNIGASRLGTSRVVKIVKKLEAEKQ